MKTKFLLASLLALSVPLPGQLNAQSKRSKQNFDLEWSFNLGDQPLASGSNVNLPHDWSIEGDFNPDNAAGPDGGYLPTGKGWYVKEFTMPEKSKDKRHLLYFEGVYMNSTVYLNGDSIGGHPYGYSSFFVDLTDGLKYGEKNTLTVKVDNSKQKNCRWYSGSGIYRHVWLISTSPTHINEWGVAITPTKEVNSDDWTLDIDVDYTCDATTNHNIINILYDRHGNEVTSSESQSGKSQVSIKNPELWTPDSPNLYTVKTQLLVNGNVEDEVTTTTGFRAIEYDAVSGLTLNGRPILLNGGCVHHDNGVLGAKSFDEAEKRKVSLLKKAGFNAVRTSHNLPSEAFLDECDRQGLLVIDEAFDGWRSAKNKHDYSELFDQWWQCDIEAMVLRDRNHPSIFCWSIGNEVIERKQLEVVSTAKKLREHVRIFDKSRPVTSALTTWDKEWEIFDPLADVHDIAGYNYQLRRAESDHKRCPERVIMQTESYPKDAYANWKRVNDMTYVIGDFVWTAIDYIGESSIGRTYYKGAEKDGFHTEHLYPWHGAYCGDIDVTGMRKPISHYRDMLYNENKKLYMAVREPNEYKGEIKVTGWGVWPTYESWNWEGHEDKPIEVEVISRYPRVRLLLNDNAVGEMSPDSTLKAVFTIPYAPGVLKVIGLDATGNETENFTLQTAGKPVAIRLIPSKKTLKADGQDLIFIEAEIVDRNGNVVPNVTNDIAFSIKGAGTIEATGSADMKDTVSYAETTRKAWHGRALAVVRSSDKIGTIKLSAKSPMLKSATLTIRSGL